jgi:hypothetical protein
MILMLECEQDRKENEKGKIIDKGQKQTHCTHDTINGSINVLFV